VPHISGACNILLVPHTKNFQQYAFRMHWCLALGIFYAWRMDILADAQRVLGYFWKISWSHAWQHYCLYYSCKQLLWQQLVDLLLQLLIQLLQRQQLLQHHQLLLQEATATAIATNTTTTAITAIMELGGRVVRVLDSGQLHQSERSWVRFLDGPLKNCQASGQSRGHVSSGWTRKNTID